MLECEAGFITPLVTQFWIIISAVIIFLILLLIASLSPRNKLRVETLQELRTLTPSAFEKAIATLLEDLGYRRVRVVGGPGDLARDISATNANDTPVTVQCKRHNKPVGSRDMQLFIGMLQTEYKGSSGIFVTTSNFTRHAWNLGKRHGVELWSGNYLADLLLKVRGQKNVIDKVSFNENVLEYKTKKENIEALLAQVKEYSKQIEETIGIIAPSVIEKDEFKMEFLPDGVHLRAKEGTEQIIKTAFERHLPNMPQNIRKIFEDLQEQLSKNRP